MADSSILKRFRTIEPIETKRDLERHLQLAIEIEHATIPPYLTALYSLQDGEAGRNAAAYVIIRRVMYEEMLHLALAANLLNAIDGRPSLAHSKFIPKYPTRLPESKNSFPVSIARCSNQSLKTFMRIEKPQYPLPVRRPAKKQVGYRTIGEFYANIWLGFQKLYAQIGDTLFSGDPNRQLIEGYKDSSVSIGRDDLVKVVDMPSAEKAIETIVHHGEGTGIPDPHLPAEERPHYFNFKDIRDRSIIGPTGSPLPSSQQFDRKAVWRMVKNPRLAGPKMSCRSKEFNECYCLMLRTLHDVFNGNPSGIFDARTAMRDCADAAVRLIQTHVGGRKYAGPTFEYIPPSRSQTSRRSSKRRLDRPPRPRAET